MLTRDINKYIQNKAKNLNLLIIEIYEEEGLNEEVDFNKHFIVKTSYSCGMKK